MGGEDMGQLIAAHLIEINLFTKERGGEELGGGTASHLTRIEVINTF